MADSVLVSMKPRCFASFTIAGVVVEIFTEKLDAGSVELQIKSAKKITALRVYQELAGFDAAAAAARPAPRVAGHVDSADRGDEKKRAAS